ncbi:porin [Rhizobium sp. SSA_523]|uniref:porin n=1 Tax=Rhizobium sp. SSA_523 TaxID=2952477 RepID=UPI0020909DA7|nr:porin [Rhizobium sp. SSA_523]MCO5730844.1 porin [Rhizobium sp. SSA_523]WKC24335.1 porin [Rhizobium sp. SSA_523]
MTMKALILSSVAALSFGSVAHSADAIIAAEPEPMEYVRVCDAFGTGYFYIPGTETCLKITGYVRFQVNADERLGTDTTVNSGGNWNARTRGLVTFESRSDTEYGPLGGTITLRSWGDSSATGTIELDDAYLTLGGFRAGYGYNYWDEDIVGETDDLGSNHINQIGYQGSFGNFKAGLFLDELNNTTSTNNDTFGIEGQISAELSAFTFALLGGYDVDKENGAVRLIATAPIGPGTLSLAAIYASGDNAYFNQAEWTIAGSYELKVTDKVKVTPGFQYWDKIDLANGDFSGSRNKWSGGVTLDYAITKDLAAKVSAQYTDEERRSEYWSGFFRLQRSF